MDQDFPLRTPSAEHQLKFNPHHMTMNKVAVESFLAKVLRPYQKEGVLFLYECVMGMRGPQVGQYWGAMLADEPGLGKTLTCIALMWTLLQQKLYGPGAEISNILIVTPTSLVDNWENDINKWLESRVEVFKVDRKENHLRSHTSSTQITIISYDSLVHQAKYALNEWDLVICDEAHILKNPETRVAKVIKNVNCFRKILLTGTPYQNTLLEFYELLNIVNPGCLGTKLDFGKRYVIPCRRSILGQQRMEELQELTSQYMLKRTRELIIDYLPPKQDLIIMCKPAFIQRKLYELAAELWNKQRFAPLPAISTMRLIGAHPSLMGKKCACQAMEQDPHTLTFSDALKTELCKNLQLWKSQVKGDEVESSGKLKVLCGILQQLHQRFYTAYKDRVLIISYFTQTLDLLQKHCRNQGYSFVCLDGSTTHAKRTALVKDFNENESIFVFLLSATAGGTGLNLPGASRVILFDLSWNPALDEQALARCWRGNQKRPVITYRLVTAGTLEEKVLQRQIQKINQDPGVSAANLDINLTEEDLKNIFSFQDDDVNMTHDVMLGCKCDGSGKNYKPVTKEQHHNLGINELRNWRHLKPRFNECVLSYRCWDAEMRPMRKIMSKNLMIFSHRSHFCIPTSELDLNNAVEEVTFIFRSVVSPVTDAALDCD